MPSNLPRPGTSFIGRHGELESIGAAFRNGARIVTLLGPPGMGKTRLALRFAQGQQEGGHWSGGLWFCDLAEATDLLGLQGAVARALDVDAEEGALERSIVARGAALLVLDNFEQVVAHAPETIGRWCAAAREARFLVTSRERLRLGAEAALEIGPLPLPEHGRDPTESDAVRLFVQRGEAARGGRGLSCVDTSSLAAIVRRLDGIPLAIEMAAARMGVLGPDQLLERLDRRFTLLVAPERDEQSRRHATLRSAIDWSWELLSPWEQTALAQSSVFRGGFRVEAAEEVLDLAGHPAAPQVIDVLQSLRDKSLLVVHDAPDLPGELRFETLVSIREYASERLEQTGLAEATRARHASHTAHACGRLAAAIHGERGLPLRRLGLERENLMAAHRWAMASPERAALALRTSAALGELLLARGPLPGLLPILDSALTAARDAVPMERGLELRVRLLRGRARLLSGAPAAGVDDFRHVLAAAREGGDEGLEGLALGLQASAAYVAGALDLAADSYERALCLVQRAGDLRLEGVFRTELGWVRLDQGRCEDAQAHFQAARHLLREVGDWRSDARNDSALGTLALRLGRVSDARSNYGDALATARGAGERRLEGQVLCNLGFVEHEDGRLEEARAAFEEALRVESEVGDLRTEGVTLLSLANLLHEQGAVAEAETLLRRAIERLQGTFDRWHEVAAHGSLAAVRATRGDEAGSITAFAVADDLREKLGSAELGALIDVQRGHLELARARSGAATRDRHLEAVRRLMPDSGTDPGRAPPFEDVRLASRVLRRAFFAAVTPPPTLVVGAAGRWLVLPGGRRIELQKGRALRQMLLILVRGRLHSPGRALSLQELFGAGWPKQKTSRETLANRVHVGIHRLKQTGLRDLILSRDDGYLLDPSVSVEQEEAMD